LKHFLETPGNVVAYDTETTGLFPFKGDRPFAFSFANQKLKTAYFEFPVDPRTREVLYKKRPKEFAAIKAILEDASIRKIGHNIKFDNRMCEGVGINVKGPPGKQFEDTMFMAFVCNTLEDSFGLKQLCMKLGVMGREDQDELLEAVKKLRLKLRKYDWKLAFEEREKADGTIAKSAAIPADYWLPAAVKIHAPGLHVPGRENLCRKYAVKDAERTMLLALFYWEKMKELDVEHTYKHEMFDLWHVVWEMENRGVCIRKDRLEMEIQQVRELMLSREKAVVKAAWPGFQISKPEHIRTLLYDKLKLSCAAERILEKSGKKSVDADALRDHDSNPVVQDIIKQRSAGKAYSSMFAKYKSFMVADKIVKGCWIVRGYFNQVGQATARFSCRDVNLQQVTCIESSRSADPIDARGAFGPRPGYVWLHIDFKGMEVRVFADCAQEPNMLKAIAEGREIHDEVTDKGWGGPYNEAGIKECTHVLGLDGAELGNDAAKILALWKKWGVTKQNVHKLSEKNRRDLVCGWLKSFEWSTVRAQESVGRKVTKNKSKMVTFCKVFGGGAEAIKDLLHVPLYEAQEFLNDYNKAFPEITRYMRDMTRQAKKDGFIRTRWNRRLALEPGFEYKAVNYMVQGSSADLLKSGMVKCDRFLKERDIDAHMIMCIHDELVFEVNQVDFTSKLIRGLQDAMEDHDGNLGVTMPTDPSYVREDGNWANKIKLKWKGGKYVEAE
jgi:DNA polymerase I-like protein with 3'-5' exonuclease and polymerase domains